MNIYTNKNKIKLIINSFNSHSKPFRAYRTHSKTDSGWTRCLLTWVALVIFSWASCSIDSRTPHDLLYLGHHHNCHSCYHHSSSTSRHLVQLLYLVIIFLNSNQISSNFSISLLVANRSSQSTLRSVSNLITPCGVGFLVS